MPFTDQFTDYPEADMPAMPAGFEDQSWKNDSCPSFHSDAKRLTIYVDYKDDGMREIPGFQRFMVFMTNADASLLDQTDAVVITDDWAAVEAFVRDYTPPEDVTMMTSAPPCELMAKRPAEAEIAAAIELPTVTIAAMNALVRHIALMRLPHEGGDEDMDAVETLTDLVDQARSITGAKPSPLPIADVEEIVCRSQADWDALVKANGDGLLEGVTTFEEALAEAKADGLLIGGGAAAAFRIVYREA